MGNLAHNYEFLYVMYTFRPFILLYLSPFNTGHTFIQSRDLSMHLL